MHILQIVHGYPPTYNAGVEVYTESVCNELSKHHKISVITREENPYAPDFEIKNQTKGPLDFYYVNNPHRKERYRDSLMDSNFAALIDRIKPDIAHVGHLYHLSTGFIDELNKRHIPIVFTLHDFWMMCPRIKFLTRSVGSKSNFKLCDGQEDHKCATECYRVYFSGREEDEEFETKSWTTWVNNRMTETKSIVDKVDLFVAPSQYLRNRFISDFDMPGHKIIHLDYGFPIDSFNSYQKNEDIRPFTFGYIGTQIVAKGINLIIEAFKQIEFPAKLKIYGRDHGQSTKALKLMAANSKNEIEFCGGYINSSLSDKIFPQLDCIIVPSIWGEISPLVIHEAQICKIPVIASNLGGMSEQIQHQINGLLFEPRNVISLLEQMNFAIENPSAMDRFAQEGYLFSKDGNVVHIEKHCKQLLNIYNKARLDNNAMK